MIPTIKKGHNYPLGIAMPRRSAHIILCSIAVYPLPSVTKDLNIVYIIHEKRKNVNSFIRVFVVIERAQAF
jgi:hypothetical protein